MAATEELGLEVTVKGFSAFMRDMNNMDRRIGGVGSAWSKLSGLASGAMKVIGGVAAVGFAAVGAAATAAGVAVAAFVKDSVEEAIDFEQQLAILSIAASDSGMSLEELGDVALQVGGDTRLLGVSATGSADAITNLYKAGLNTSAVFGDLNAYMEEGAELGGALRASIDLAAASELDMGQSAELAAIMLATFGGEMETAAEQSEFINTAMNTLVKAADASVADVSDLAEAFRIVGPTANAAGFSIEDTSTALAVLSEAGIRGSRAGTNLEAALRSLRNPTDEAAGMMRDLGVNLFDAEGAALPFRDVLGQLETSMAGMTEQQRAMALGTIFTANGQRVMTALVEQGVEGWDEMGVAMGNAAGIQEQAAIRAGTFAGQMEAMEGVIETLKIQVGQAFLPVLESLVVMFTELVDRYGPLVAEIFQNIAGAIEPFVNWLSFAVSEGDLLNDFLTELPGPFQEFVKWLSFAVEEGDPFNDFITHLPGPLQLVIESVLALGGTLQEWFGENGPALLEQLGEIWNTTWTAVQEITAGFVAWWVENLPLIQETITVILDWLLNTVLPFMSDVWTVIVEIVSTAMTIIQEAITLAMQLITGDWQGAWETIKVIAETAGNALVELISMALTLIVEYATRALTNLQTSFMEKFNRMRDITRETWQQIKEVINEALREVWEAVKAKTQEMIDVIKSRVSGFVSAGRAIIDGVRSGVMQAAGALARAAANAVRNALAAAKAAVGIQSPSSVFRSEVGQQIGRGIALGIGDLVPTVQAQIATAVSPSGSGGSSSTTVTDNSVTNFNLTTNSVTRPGGLEMEFGAMAIASSATR